MAGLVSLQINKTVPSSDTSWDHGVLLYHVPQKTERKRGEEGDVAIPGGSQVARAEAGARAGSQLPIYADTSLCDPRTLYANRANFQAC